MQIENGQVVILTYTATDADGKVLEAVRQPMAYLHGRNNFIEALEPALAGLSAGETFEVAVQDAYGPAPSQDPMPVPKKEFPKGWDFWTGLMFAAPGSDGTRANLFVHDVRGSRVFVSPEHPWGGRKVTFTGTIHQIRPATYEEHQHGHAHGPGGHAHH